MAKTEKKSKSTGNDYLARRSAKDDGRGSMRHVKSGSMGKNPIGSAPSKRAPHQ